MPLSPVKTRLLVFRVNDPLPTEVTKVYVDCAEADKMVRESPIENDMPDDGFCIMSFFIYGLFARAEDTGHRALESHRSTLGQRTLSSCDWPKHLYFKARVIVP